MSLSISRSALSSDLVLSVSIGESTNFIAQPVPRITHVAGKSDSFFSLSLRFSLCFLNFENEFFESGFYMQSVFVISVF